MADLERPRPTDRPCGELTQAAADEQDVDPVFSPDGKSILFTSTRGGNDGRLEDVPRGRQARADLRRRPGRMVARRPGHRAAAQRATVHSRVGRRAGETHQPERLAALLRPRVEPGREMDRLCLPLGRRQRPVSRSRRRRRAEDRVRQARGLRAALVAGRQTAGLRNRGPPLHHRSRRQERIVP